MEGTKVVAKIENNIQIISLNGRLTYDYIGDYKTEVMDSIQNAKGYIINLGGVDQVDSTGMGLLVNTAKHFITNKHKMVLVITDSLIGELFTIAKLDKVFEICTSIEEAKKILNLEDDEYWSRVAGY